MSMSTLEQLLGDKDIGHSSNTISWNNVLADSLLVLLKRSIHNNVYLSNFYKYLFNDTKTAQLTSQYFTGHLATCETTCAASIRSSSSIKSAEKRAAGKS